MPNTFEHRMDDPDYDPNSPEAWNSHGWKGGATPVKLFKGWDCHEELWHGTFDELKSNNPDLEDVQARLFTLGFAFIGGGASQAFTVEVVR